MEEYFVQKCVTSDASQEPTEAISTWATTRRCECVVVQENAHANGASRAVLAAVVVMTTASKKTQRVALCTLEPPLTSLADGASAKLVALNFSSDWSWLEAGLSDTPEDSPLLDKMQDRLNGVLKSAETSSSPSSRPNVVVIDSLNVLLEIYPLARVLAWLRQLRRNPQVGSVIFRINASASPSASMVQTLAHEATAVVQVETHLSLLAYPILAKERRREIPKKMHGLVLLLRKKKNGRTSESVEYFQVSNGRMEFSSDGESVSGSAGTNADGSTKSALRKSGGEAAQVPARPVEAASSGSTIGTGKALPVGADEVSFNLSISAEEEIAKRNVQLPYMHQGAGGGGQVNNLLFIDEDDPDWDDDDLDDDLDI